MIPEVDTNFVSENEFDFREVSFTLPTNALNITGTESGRVKSFAVKVCMYRPNTTTKVPLIKDLRIVALDMIPRTDYKRDSHSGALLKRDRDALQKIEQEKWKCED